MLDKIFGFIGGLLKPATELIDSVTTTDEEKRTLKNELLRIQTGFQSTIIEYEGQLMEAQSKIIVAEAQGQSWLQRNWRPITMITFLILVVFDCFGWLKFRLSGEAWTLLQIGLGGYVVGRSGEKIFKEIQKGK